MTRIDIIYRPCCPVSKNLEYLGMLGASSDRLPFLLDIGYLDVLGCPQFDVGDTDGILHPLRVELDYFPHR